MRRHHQLAIFAASLIVIALGVYILLEPHAPDAGQRRFGQHANRRRADRLRRELRGVPQCRRAGDRLPIRRLNTVGLQQMDYDTLYKTIARGRYNTAMPAWSVTDGGPLNDAAIEAVIALIQHGDWQQTQIVVADLGLAPRVPMSVTVPITTLQTIAALPNGAALSSGVQTLRGQLHRLSRRQWRGHTARARAQRSRHPHRSHRRSTQQDRQPGLTRHGHGRLESETIDRRRSLISSR